MLGYSDSKVKVSRNLSIISGHVMVPLRNSGSVYQFLGTVSKVWMNRWTHSSSGISDQLYSQIWICDLGSLFPVYFYCKGSLSLKNLIAINILKSSHDAICSLCACHHLASVALTARSIVVILCSWGISCSNYCIKSLTSAKRWKDGISLTSAPIHRSDLVINAHLRAETS